VYFTWADVGNPVGTPNRAAVTDWQFRVVGKSATPVTVWVNAIGHYPRRNVFPNGCISFACDDGRLSQYTRMAPALDKYGYGATAYVITEYLGDVNKMTYAQAKELENFHRWEIGGHAYSKNAHDNGMTSLSLPDLDVELRNLRNWLQQGNHKAADLFAYPLGYDNPDVVEVVSRYFTNARQIVRAPFQNVDLDQPYRMRSNSMSSSDLLATAKTWVDKAVANGVWFTITMHDIVDGTPASGTEWSTADFQALVDYVAASGAECMPVGAALDKITGNRPSVALPTINGGTP
jgi:peptidoglycan/xylan/chitin deacetylase (PgdA/CDA1 family)